jgi:hypothetical protein
LNGVVIRIAQKMGLHRDGEILGLSPFEAEMRRRLWWQIIMLDAKYAMLSGLSHSLLPRSWDTKEPHNVNDVDLYPTATEPFQDRDGPTEMIFCLMTNKVAKFLVQTPGLETMILATELELPPGSNASQAGYTEQYAEYRKALRELHTDLVTLLDQYCDVNAGPVHQMTSKMKNHIIVKLDELITPPRQQPEWGTEIRSLKDNAFKVAINTLEHNTLNYLATKDKGFLWYTRMYFQIDVFMYMVGQLCHRKEGTLVDRAWDVCDIIYDYHPELFDVSNKTYLTLAIFILKAWTMREEVLRGKGQPRDATWYIEKLRGLVGDDYKSEPTPVVEASPQPNLSFASAPPTTMMAHDSNQFDQFLGGYLDNSAIEWDMFGLAPQPGASGSTGQTMSFNYGVPRPGGW